MNLLALQTLRRRHDATPEQPAHRNQHDDGEDLLAEHEQLPERSWQKVLVAEAGPDTMQQNLGGAGREHQETPEHRGMRQAGAALTQNPGLCEPDGDQVPGAALRMIEPILGKAELQVADQSLDVVAEEAQCSDEDEQESEILSGHDKSIR